MRTYSAAALAEILIASDRRYVKNAVTNRNTQACPAQFSFLKLWYSNII
jgi:hypothetical protein